MSASKYFRSDHQAIESWIKYTRSYYDMFIMHLLDPKENELILDDGCGNGRFSTMMADKTADVIAFDLNKSLLKVASEKGSKSRGTIAVVLGDMQNLPFRSYMFDKVLCVHNLWVIPNYEAAVGEMIRTSKNNGKIIIDHLNLFHWENFLSEIVYMLSKTLRRHPMPIYYRTPNQIFGPFKANSNDVYTLNSSRDERTLVNGKRILRPRFIIKSTKTRLKSKD